MDILIIMTAVVPYTRSADPLVAPGEGKLKDFPVDFRVTLKADATEELPDGVVIDLPEVRQMESLVELLEDMGPVDVIPLVGINVNNNAVANIVNFLRLLKQNPLPPKKDSQNALRVEEQSWEKDLYDQLWNFSKGALFNFLLAANRLGIKVAVDSVCLNIANRIKGKTPEEIRAMFTVE